MLELVVGLTLAFLPSLVIVRFKLHWLSLVLTGVGLEVLGFALLGLPGAAFLGLTEVVMTGLGKNPIPADSVWGTAIFISLLLPLALVPAWFVVRRLQVRVFWRQIAVFGSLFFGGACLVGVGTYLYLF